jgi:hypothetical protein
MAWFKRWVWPIRSHRTTIQTSRHPLLHVAGKLVQTARRCFLMLSERYRYQAVWQLAIARLTHLQFGSCFPVDSGYYFSRKSPEIFINGDIELEQGLWTAYLLLDEHRTLQGMSGFRTTLIPLWSAALQSLPGFACASP